MLRSGLALAGFNCALAGLPMAADMENGMLAAADVLTMSLSKTRLVVLSACDTALGAIVSNEGVFGLRRAFAVAGADTLVMSLWPVSDQETSTLMVDFHRRVTRGEPLASALQASQLALRKTRAHPHYWAAFVLAGRPEAIDAPATTVTRE
jgi:CHAT domain-containing protein